MRMPKDPGRFVLMRLGQNCWRPDEFIQGAAGANSRTGIRSGGATRRKAPAGLCGFQCGRRLGFDGRFGPRLNLTLGGHRRRGS